MINGLITPVEPPKLIYKSLDFTVGHKMLVVAQAKNESTKRSQFSSQNAENQHRAFDCWSNRTSNLKMLLDGVRFWDSFAPFL